MPKKLKARPVSSPPTSTGTQSFVSISPTGRFINIFDSSEVTATWRWNGATYVSLGTGLVNGLQAGEYTEDEAYIVGLNSGTGQRLQLRSVNTTTGATTILHGLPSSTIPLEMDAALIRVTGDYFVAYNRNKAAGSVFLVKLDRGSNTLVLKNVITLNDIRFALQSYGFKIPGKPAFLFSQRQDSSSAINIVRVNTANETLEAPANVVTGAWADGPFTSIAISDNGNFWYGQHPTNPALNRYGTVNADTNTLVVSGAVPTAKAGIYSSFVFDSQAIFTPKITAGGPYDQYQLFNPANGAITADPGGTFAPMDAPAGAFSNAEPRKNYDSTNAAPKKFAFLTNRSLAVNPGFYVYEEGEAPIDVNLVAMAPTPDAFISAQEHSTLSLEALAPMPVAVVTSQVNETVTAIAMAPLPDATIEAQTFTEAILRACAPMPYAELISVGQRAQFEAMAPMPDAFAEFQRVEGSFVVVAPMPDAFITTDANISGRLFAMAPMPSATITTLGQRGNLVATAPMPDAFVTFEGQAKPGAVFFVIRKG